MVVPVELRRGRAPGVQHTRSPVSSDGEMLGEEALGAAGDGGTAGLRKALWAVRSEIGWSRSNGGWLVDLAKWKQGTGRMRIARREWRRLRGRGRS